MNQSCKYIENILLEIIDRPDCWLEKGHSNKLNIRTFNSHNAALAFLQKYNQWNFVKAQKIILNYNNKRLHLIVRHLKYGNIDEKSKEISNTTVEFIYRRLIFSQIKWPKVVINKSQSESKNQLKTTEEIIDHNNTRIPRLLFTEVISHSSALSNIIEDSQGPNYQSINNFQRITDGSLTLGHTNEQETRF